VFSVVNKLSKETRHRDTENTEVAQRNQAHFETLRHAGRKKSSAL